MHDPTHHTLSVPRTLLTAVVAAILPAPIAAADPPVYHATILADQIEAVFPGVTFPSSDSRGLNENGDLVGEARLNGSQMQGFVYTVEHGVVPLPLLPGWSSAAVRDVTERDANGEILIVGGGAPSIYVDIVIGEAALWRFSTVTGQVLETRNIGIPAGFDDSFAVAVNNDGTVVGYSSLVGPFSNWKYDVATDILETFEFPVRVADLNNVGQVVGGSYRGDLLGNYEDLTDVFDPGDVMPQWAIDNGGITAAWNRINDLGWAVGRAPTGISDGAGHLLAAIVRFADPIGWTGMPPVSHLSLAGGINDDGDFMTYFGGAYLQETGLLYPFNSLLSPEFAPLVNFSTSVEINNNRQAAGSQAHAILLTPLGEMIVPGDVNGDVSVNLDDYCAWVAMPIDLNGDGIVNDADEQWLVDRLLVFGFTVEDCNGNGACDHCDIAQGASADCDGNDVPDECQPDCNGDGVPDVCESDCNTNGTPDPCDIAQGASQDCNGNGIPDECDGGGVIEASAAYDPPLFMYQDDTIVQEILVTEAGIIDDVDLTLHYIYRIGYTSVQLSHNGTTVTILDRPGHPQHLDGFVNFGYDAIVDDDAPGARLELTGDECCSFETILSPPSYLPNQPLNAFDGMPMQGIWTFSLTTTPDFSNGDGLHGWGLTITKASVPVPPCCPSDLDANGVVGVNDLLALLAAWGPNPAHPADMDGDGTVGTTDLLTLLADWGGCF